MGDRSWPIEVRRTVGLNAAQKPLSNDTWCQTHRHSKLTYLFILLTYLLTYLLTGGKFVQSRYVHCYIFLCMICWQLQPRSYDPDVVLVGIVGWRLLSLLQFRGWADDGAAILLPSHSETGEEVREWGKVSNFTLVYSYIRYTRQSGYIFSRLSLPPIWFVCFRPSIYVQTSNIGLFLL